MRRISNMVGPSGALFLSLFIFLCVQFSEEAVKEKSCQMAASDLTKIQLKGVMTCTKELKFKNGREKSKKMNCILRCVLIKEDILTPEGLATPAQWDAFLYRHIPQAHIDHFNATFNPCMPLAYNDAHTIDEDPYCTSLEPFIKCAFGVVSGLCNWS